MPATSKNHSPTSDPAVGFSDLLGVPLNQRHAYGAHESARMEKDEWLTPPEILTALGGPESFDLDPASPIKRPWPTAKKHYTVMDNGLVKPWHGRVWLNPPYGQECQKWLRRLSDHGNGIALIFARTETRMWFDSVWPKASGILFIKGRLHYYHVNGRARGNAGAPSALIGYGNNNLEAIMAARIDGALWTPNAPDQRPGATKV